MHETTRGRYLAISSISLALLLSGCSASEGDAPAPEASPQTQEQPAAEQTPASDPNQHEIDDFKNRYIMPSTHTGSQNVWFNSEARRDQENVHFSNDKVFTVTEPVETDGILQIKVLDANTGKESFSQDLKVDGEIGDNSYRAFLSIKDGKQYFNVIRVGAISAESDSLAKATNGIYLSSIDTSLPADQAKVIEDSKTGNWQLVAISDPKLDEFVSVVADDEDDNTDSQHFTAVGDKLIEVDVDPEIEDQEFVALSQNQVVKIYDTFLSGDFIGVPNDWNLLKAAGTDIVEGVPVEWVKNGFMLTNINDSFQLVDLESRKIIAKVSEESMEFVERHGDVSDNRKFAVFGEHLVDIDNKKLTSFPETATTEGITFTSVGNEGIAYGSAGDHGEVVVTVDIKTGKATPVTGDETQPTENVAYVSSTGTIIFDNGMIVGKP